ncbi:PIN domain-containing protein [Opitutaceae bacterium]
MKAACFIDTNILLYRASTDEAERPKRAIAEILLQRGDIGLSAQVLAEFYHNAISKPGLRMPAERATAIVEALTLLPIVPVTAEIVQSAIRLQQRYRISYWDASILAAAKELAATTVFSEDLAHSQIYDGVTVLNPFLPDVQLPG